MPKQDLSTLVSQLVQYTDTERGSQYYRYIGNIGNKVNKSSKNSYIRTNSTQIPKQDLSTLDSQLDQYTDTEIGSSIIRYIGNEVKIMHKQNKFTRQKTSKILGNFYFKTLVTKTVIYNNTYTHKHT